MIHPRAVYEDCTRYQGTTWYLTSQVRGVLILYYLVGPTANWWGYLVQSTWIEKSFQRSTNWPHWRRQMAPVMEMADSTTNNSNTKRQHKATAMPYQAMAIPCDAKTKRWHQATPRPSDGNTKRGQDSNGNIMCRQHQAMAKLNDGNTKRWQYQAAASLLRQRQQ